MRFLQVVFQEAALHQFVQLVPQRQTVAQTMAKGLVEFTPSALAGPQPFVSLWGIFNLSAMLGITIRFFNSTRKLCLGVRSPLLVP